MVKKLYFLNMLSLLQYQIRCCQQTVMLGQMQIMTVLEMWRRY